MRQLHKYVLYVPMLVLFVPTSLSAQSDVKAILGDIAKDQVEQLRSSLDLKTEQVTKVEGILKDIAEQENDIQKKVEEIYRKRNDKIEEVLDEEQKEKLKSYNGLPDLLGEHDARKFGWSHNPKHRNREIRNAAKKVKISKEQKAEIGRLMLEEDKDLEGVLDEVLTQEQKQEIAKHKKEKNENKKKGNSSKAAEKSNKEKKSNAKANKGKGNKK